MAPAGAQQNSRRPSCPNAKASRSPGAKLNDQVPAVPPPGRVTAQVPAEKVSVSTLVSRMT